MKLLAFILAFNCFQLFAADKSPKDSIGLSKVKKDTVIIHKVDKGEGLLSIARRYNTTVEEIQKLNKGIKTVKINQKLKIPYSPAVVNANRNNIDSSKITIDESHANADSKDFSYVKKHKVQQGETLTKIAGKYKITAQQLIKWNNIKNNTIVVGQELNVSGVSTIKSYEKWNANNSISTQLDTMRFVLSGNLNFVEESGMAQPSLKITHPTLQPGDMILCINPINQKQLLIQIEQNGTLDNNNIIGLTNETLSQLHISSDNPSIIIKYNQP